MSLFDMTGTVAVVTGSTKGIGREIVEQMVIQGAKVIVSSRKQAECDQVAAELNDKHGQGDAVARGIAYDISQVDKAPGFAAACEAAFGRVDALVGNAAVLPTDDFDAVLTGNIHGSYALAAAFRPVIARQGGGAIVLVGSIAGHYPMPELMAYGAAKAGVAHLARLLAEQMLPDNIRVNCVSPGLIRASAARKSGDEEFKRRGSGVPIGRGGEPEEIAGAVIFLTSKAGGYVTGTTVWVDGGRAFLKSRPVPPA